jgi:glycosyltransferase involved in cell wall biosynthesis
VESRTRILFVNPHIVLNGANLAFFNLVKNLNTSRFESVGLDFVKPGEVKFVQRFYQHYHKIFPFYPQKSISRLQTLLCHGPLTLKALHRTRPHLIYLNGFISHAQLLLFFWLLKPFYRFKLILHLHETGWALESKSRLARYLNFNLPDRIVTVSAAGVEAVKPYGISDDKIEILHETIDTSAIDRALDGPAKVRSELLVRVQKKIVLMGCGSIQERKGFDIFCSTMEILATEYKLNNLFFLWIGDAPDGSAQKFKESVLSRLEELGIRERLHITGEVYPPQDYQRLADVYLMTSRDDPFPLTTLEALYLGLPVVYFEVGGTPEAVGGLGYKAGRPSAQQMASAVKRLLDNWPESEKLRTLRRERVLANYTPQIVVPRLEKFFGSVLGWEEGL